MTFIVVGVLLNAAAQLLLKAGVAKVGPIVTFDVVSVWPMATVLMKSVYVPLGLACYVVSVVVWIIALSRVPVSVAYPMLSLGYVVNAFAAWVLFAEALSAQKLIGIAVIIVGVFLVARS